jgi:pilus assembly protein CpaC
MRKFVVLFLALSALASGDVFAAEGRVLQSNPRAATPVQEKPVVAGDTGTTVLLKVSLIEISVTKLRQQGVEFEKLLAENAPKTDAPKAKPSDAVVELFSDWTPENLGCFLLRDDDSLLTKVKRLIKSGTAKMLAQPVLVTESGRAANFSAGREIPVPVPQSAGTVTIEWKRCGMQIDFLPVVLNTETLRLELRTRISELDESTSITIAGTTVPGMTILTDVDTAFKIKVGQIAVVNGGARSFAVRESDASADKKEHKPNAEVDSSPEVLEQKAILVLIKPEIVEPAK